jgi:hypothetical protein
MLFCPYSLVAIRISGQCKSSVLVISEKSTMSFYTDHKYPDPVFPKKYTRSFIHGCNGGFFAGSDESLGEVYKWGRMIANSCVRFVGGTLELPPFGALIP